MLVTSFKTKIVLNHAMWTYISITFRNCYAFVVFSRLKNFALNFLENALLRWYVPEANFLFFSVFSFPKWSKIFPSSTKLYADYKIAILLFVKCKEFVEFGEF